jgi:hypothetical protein
MGGNRSQIGWPRKRLRQATSGASSTWCRSRLVDRRAPEAQVANEELLRALGAADGLALEEPVAPVPAPCGNVRNARPGVTRSPESGLSSPYKSHSREGA